MNLNENKKERLAILIAAYCYTQCASKSIDCNFKIYENELKKYFVLEDDAFSNEEFRKLIINKLKEYKGINKHKKIVFEKIYNQYCLSFSLYSDYCVKNVDNWAYYSSKRYSELKDIPSPFSKNSNEIYTKEMQIERLATQIASHYYYCLVESDGAINWYIDCEDLSKYFYVYDFDLKDVNFSSLIIEKLKQYKGISEDTIYYDDFYDAIRFKIHENYCLLSAINNDIFNVLELCPDYYDGCDEDDSY